MNRPDLRLGLLLAAAVLAGGCGSAVGARRTVATAAGTGTSSATANPTAPAVVDGPHRSHTASAPTPVPARSSADRRSPALRHLQAELVRALRHEGRQTGILVYDLTARRILFTQRADVRRPPASVEKIYTTVALLQLLGPAARLHTDLLATGHLGRGGVWHGNLYLRGDGDPTFGDGTYSRVYAAGRGARVSALVAQLHRRGIRRVAGLIYGDGSRFDALRGNPFTNGQPDLPDYGGEMSALVFDHGASTGRLSPPAFAARELALTMRAQHIFAKAAPVPRRTPRRAHLLATDASPPLTVMLKLMDVPSDDLFADLFAKQLGYRFLGSGTLQAGAAEVLRALSVYRLGRVVIHDGSGLDPRDRTTPAQVVALLRQTWNTPVGQMLMGALPVVGESGTVAAMGNRTPAQGHCMAKTGTLNDVTNLAGVCRARGRHQLAFAMFIDGPENWQALSTLGRMVGAIAGY